MTFTIPTKQQFIDTIFCKDNILSLIQYIEAQYNKPGYVIDSIANITLPNNILTQKLNTDLEINKYIYDNIFITHPQDFFYSDSNITCRTYRISITLNNDGSLYNQLFEISLSNNLCVDRFGFGCGISIFDLDTEWLINTYPSIYNFNKDTRKYIGYQIINEDYYHSDFNIIPDTINTFNFSTNARKEELQKQVERLQKQIEAL